MTLTSQDDLDGLKEVGRIVANTLHGMAKAIEPGMTTRELDDIGLCRGDIDSIGAQSRF